MATVWQITGNCVNNGGSTKFAGVCVCVSFSKLILPTSSNLCNTLCRKGLMCICETESVFRVIFSHKLHHILFFDHILYQGVMSLGSAPSKSCVYIHHFLQQS